MSVHIGIIMGSDTDLPVMSEAAIICKEFAIPYELRIVSAHRTPEDMANYGKSALDKGLNVIIAGAGGAAHLPGMIASYTILPVIGVPIKSSSLLGIDSLLSIVQMPPGVPVATVAVNAGKNAGLLALQILSLQNPTLQKQLQEYKIEMANLSRLKNNNNEWSTPI